MQANIPSINILIVEDRLEDFEFTKECLSNLSLGSPQRIECLSDLQKTLKKSNFDVILLDLGLPETKGLETVEKAMHIIRETASNHPAVVVLTGMNDFAISKMALKMGAKDYLIKGEYSTSDMSRALSFATFSSGNPRRRKKKIAFPFFNQ